MSASAANQPNLDQVVGQFRLRYLQLQASVQSCLLAEFGDSAVIARVGDKLDDYLRAFQQVCISEAPSPWLLIITISAPNSV